MEQNKLLTPLGEIQIFIDEKPVEYEAQFLNCERFCADLSVKYVPDGQKHTVTCKIKGYIPSVNDEIESGERLELKSFYNGKTKLSIGTEGDSYYLSNEIRISDYDYDYDIAYLKDGMEYEILPFTKTEDYLFGIAWIENYNDENSVQTWFGADPTMI